MRRYAWMLAAVVVLLAAQAACELWLPTYTAAIVDVGIQQEGVESPVPEAVRGERAGRDARRDGRGRRRRGCARPTRRRTKRRFRGWA